MELLSATCKPLQASAVVNSAAGTKKLSPPFENTNGGAACDQSCQSGDYAAGVGLSRPAGTCTVVVPRRQQKSGKRLKRLGVPHGKNLYQMASFRQWLLNLEAQAEMAP